MARRDNLTLEEWQLVLDAEEEFEPIWVDLDVALKIFKDEDSKLKKMIDKNYSETFPTRRDLSILEFLKSIKLESRTKNTVGGE